MAFSGGPVWSNGTKPHTVLTVAKDNALTPLQLTSIILQTAFMWKEVDRYYIHTHTHKKVLMLHKPPEQCGWLICLDCGTKVCLIRTELWGYGPFFLREGEKKNNRKIISHVGLITNLWLHSLIVNLSVYSAPPCVSGAELLCFGTDVRPLAQPCYTVKNNHSHANAQFDTFN